MVGFVTSKATPDPSKANPSVNLPVNHWPELEKAVRSGLEASW
ncbi:hypothetical protein [Synechococcus sp. MIT S9451]